MLAVPPPSQLATIEEFVRRARALYSLPAVAVEVLRLTDHPKVDVPALKACIERDPALTAKLLRVVNSSLFGLPREVADLNQALALLGTKPLKLLVLGFSLPENLLLEAAGPQLQWYWKSTLARAVAAREISERLFNRPGDDAFLAGLLQGLGVLVLLGQLRAPYAALINQSLVSGAELTHVEQRALGFDHTQLTASLLDAWNMPPALGKALSQPRDYRRWAHSRADHAPLIRILHLAELVAQLVGQHRLSVLPDLLEAGGAYCNLDKPKLYDLVASLEPKVRQLAGALSVDAKSTSDYAAIIAEAHARMAQLAETAVPSLCALEPCGAVGEPLDQVGGVVLAVKELRQAVDMFLNRPSAVALAASAPPEGSAAGCSASLQLAHQSIPVINLAAVARDDLMVRLLLSVGECRSSRQPLSVVLLQIAPQLQDGPNGAPLELLLDEACRIMMGKAASLERIGPHRRALILSRQDRHEAVATAHRIKEAFARLAARQAPSEYSASPVLAAGIASVLMPAKNFQASRLIETAQRCLVAAFPGGGVKSLEIS